MPSRPWWYSDKPSDRSSEPYLRQIQRRRKRKLGRRGWNLLVLIAILSVGGTWAYLSNGEDTDSTPSLAPTATPAATTPSAPNLIPTSVPPTTVPPPDQGTGSYSQAEAAVAQRINEFRANRGLSILALSEELVSVARAHSRDMAERNFFDHVNPDGWKPQDRVEGAGLDNFSCGENLFQITDGLQDSNDFITSEAFTGWLNSPGHFENMVKPSHNTGGVGVYVKSKFIIDLSPRRYDIYVTHLLCRDISEYNKLYAQYEEAKIFYDRLDAEFESLKTEYNAIEERHLRNEMSRSQLEAAFEKLEATRTHLNAQSDIVNMLVEQLNVLVNE